MHRLDDRVQAQIGGVDDHSIGEIAAVEQLGLPPDVVHVVLSVAAVQQSLGEPGTVGPQSAPGNGDTGQLIAGHPAFRIDDTGYDYAPSAR